MTPREVLLSSGKRLVEAFARSAPSRGGAASRDRVPSRVAEPTGGIATAFPDPTTRGALAQAILQARATLPWPSDLKSNLISNKTTSAMIAPHIIKQGFEPITDGEATCAALQKVAVLRSAVEALESEQAALSAEIQAADQRAADACAKRNSAEALHRRSVLGETVAAPTAEELANLMANQAIAERDASNLREQAQSETARISAQLEKARRKVPEAENAVDVARFHELVGRYREVIRGGIQLAVALRAAAQKIGRRVEGEPMLIDTDHDFGGQIFGIPLD